MSTSAETGFEWLVIDGSTDESAVPALMSASDNPNTRYSWSAPQGVYPAMNTGLATATGDYVLFLNAGDELSDPTTAENLATTLSRDRPLWLFGQVCFISEDGRRVTPPPMDYARERASSFSRGRFPPHQGTIVNRQALIDNGGFDTSYHIAADYAACLRLVRQQDPVIIDDTIANFYEGGLSTQSWRESMREFHRARREILRPTGAAAVSEWLNTRIGIAKAHIYRRWMK
jgi:glycosyltransferase involved in cell wall biosynthesis